MTKDPQIAKNILEQLETMSKKELAMLEYEVRKKRELLSDEEEKKIAYEKNHIGKSRKVKLNRTETAMLMHMALLANDEETAQDAYSRYVGDIGADRFWRKKYSLESVYEEFGVKFSLEKGLHLS